MVKIKVLQVNLNRSKEAHVLAESTADKQGREMLLVSEPNKATVTKEGHKWEVDRRVDAAIWCNGSSYVVRRRGRGDGYVWVELDDVIVYSCYFSPNRSLEEFTTFLEDVDRSYQSIGNGRVVITGDFNAAAVEWGSKRTCKRGEALLE